MHVWPGRAPPHDRRAVPRRKPKDQRDGVVVRSGRRRPGLRMISQSSSSAVTFSGKWRGLAALYGTLGIVAGR